MKTPRSKTRLLWVLATVVLLVLSIAAVVTAPPASANGRRHYTVDQLMNQLVGYHVVFPAKGAEVTIAGFTKFTERKWGTRWYPYVYVSRTCTAAHTCQPSSSSSAATREGFKLTPGGWQHIGTAARTPVFQGSPSGYHQRSTCWYCWAEFWNWNWSGIFSWVWIHIIKRCLNGAVGGMGTLGTHNLAVKLITRSGYIFRGTGPEGWAIAGLAGCTFNVFFQAFA